MNEIIFFVHIIVLIVALLTALRIGITAVVALICIFTAFMNIFVVKQIILFGFTVTPTDAFTVAISIGLNLIQEYKNQAAAQRAIIISFFTAIVVLAISSLHLLYTPSPTDTMHNHFFMIFSFLPRIVIASVVTYLCVMYVDTILYGILKKKFDNRYLVGRNYISLLICQLLDTVMFSLLGLWGIAANIGHIIVVSYGVKLITIAIMTPFVSFARTVRTIT